MLKNKNTYIERLTYKNNLRINENKNSIIYSDIKFISESIKWEGIGAKVKNKRSIN